MANRTGRRRSHCVRAKRSADGQEPSRLIAAVVNYYTSEAARTDPNEIVARTIVVLVP
jgi:hypothetical protein